jgi:hypothetical protein
MIKFFLGFVRQTGWPDAFVKTWPEMPHNPYFHLILCKTISVKTRSQKNLKNWPNGENSPKLVTLSVKNIYAPIPHKKDFLQVLVNGTFYVVVVHFPYII